MPPDARSAMFVRYSGLLSNAIDEGLSALGELPKDAIYQTLRTDFSMRKTDIPMRFVEFSSILKENIGLGAKPLLEFIVNRFSDGLRIGSLSCIDLDESIKRVDMILKGDLKLPLVRDHASHTVSVTPNGKTIDETCGSIRLTSSQIGCPDTSRSITVKTPSEETHKRTLGRAKNRGYRKANSET